MKKLMTICDKCGETLENHRASEVTITVVGTAVARTFPNKETFDLCHKCQVILAEAFPIKPEN